MATDIQIAEILRRHIFMDDDAGAVDTHIGGNFTGGDGTGGNQDDGGVNLHLQTPLFWGELDDADGFEIEFKAIRTNSNDTRAILGSSEDSRLFGVWVTSAGTTIWVSVGGTSDGVGRQNWAVAADLFDTERTIRVVWDGGSGPASNNFEVFVDDVSQGKQTITTPFQDDGLDSPIWIGRNQESTGLSKWDMWFGQIRDVKLTVGSTVLADWPLSQFSGLEAADESGNGNVATVSTFAGDANAAQQAIFWRANVLTASNAFFFDGDDDYGLVTNDASLDPGTSDFSIAMRVNIADASKTQKLMDRSDGTERYQFNMAGGDLTFVVDTSGVNQFGWNSSLAPTNDTTHSIVLSVDRSGNATPYLDGVAGTTDDVSAGVSDNMAIASDMWIFERDDDAGGAQHGFGHLIEMVIWIGTALTAQQAMDFDNGIIADGATSRWMADGSSTTEIVDSIGSNDMAMTGARPSYV